MAECSADAQKRVLGPGGLCSRARDASGTDTCSLDSMGNERLRLRWHCVPRVVLGQQERWPQESALGIGSPQGRLEAQPRCGDGVCLASPECLLWAPPGLGGPLSALGPRWTQARLEALPSACGRGVCSVAGRL